MVLEKGSEDLDLPSSHCNVHHSISRVRMLKEGKERMRENKIFKTPTCRFSPTDFS